MARLKLHNGVVWPDGTTQDTAPTPGGGSDIKLGFAVYEFDDGVDGSTSSGTFEFDNADPSLAAIVYLNDLDVDGVDWSALFDSWNATVQTGDKGTLIFRAVADPTIYAMYSVISIVNGSGEFQFGIFYIANNGAFTDTDEVFVEFIPNGNAGNPGASSPIAIEQFAELSSQADSDPGSGNFKFNHVTQGSATQLYLDVLDLHGVDISAILDDLDTVPGSNKGYVRISGGVDPNTSFILFRLTDVISASGYRKLAVTFIMQTGSNPLADDEAVTLSFSRNGDDPLGSLSPSNDDFVQRKAGAWANRTIAQVKTDLAINNVDNTSNATERAATATLTNKRITKRGTTVNAPGATPTINTDNGDVFIFTGLATAITSMSTNLSGSPNAYVDTLWIIFVDNGTARAIAWGAGFEASTVALPTTTVISTPLDVGFRRNGANTAWRCIAKA